MADWEALFFGQRANFCHMAPIANIIVAFWSAEKKKKTVTALLCKYMCVCLYLQINVQIIIYHRLSNIIYKKKIKKIPISIAYMEAHFHHMIKKMLC